MGEQVVTWRDCRKLGAGRRTDRYCREGVRKFCELHGLSFELLISSGIPISDLEHLDDLYVRRLIATVRERENEHR